MSSKQSMAKLLQTIERNDNTFALLRQGMSYSQIASLLDDVVRRKFVEQSGSKLVLTQAGRQFLVKTGTGPSEGPASWIRPLEEAKIDPQYRTKVYAPAPNSVFFRRP
jgi:hypothetical protein